MASHCMCWWSIGSICRWINLSCMTNCTLEGATIGQLIRVIFIHCWFLRVANFERPLVIWRTHSWAKSKENLCRTDMVHWKFIIVFKPFQFFEVEPLVCFWDTFLVLFKQYALESWQLMNLETTTPQARWCFPTSGVCIGYNVVVYANLTSSLRRLWGCFRNNETNGKRTNASCD